MKGESAVLPKDPMLLVSVVNTRLRDEYASLDELCRALDEDRQALEEKLEAAGFQYDEDRNAFR